MSRARRPQPSAALFLVALGSAMSGACTQRDSPDAAASSSSAAASVSASGSALVGLPDGGGAPRPSTSTSTSASASPLAEADGGSAAPLHKATQEELLRLIGLPERKGKAPDFGPFLRKAIGPGGPSRANQGNPELARHDIARAQCLAGLEGVTLQSDAQKATCQGRPMMVPIHEGGAAPKTCIDVFEFPNVPCELPFVWMPSTWARETCKAQGKRLCTQEEWVLACGGDPAGGGGGKAWKHAYGDELDLAACNTQKSTKASGCDADTAGSAWKTCATLTEPSGSFPRCRSRFGVYDLHGNVAEEMTRLDPDGQVYSQLKGSAFFYVDVARKPGDAAKRENYLDHCGHDPRWHVEPIGEALHANYHLGFRCCLSLD